MTVDRALGVVDVGLQRGFGVPIPREPDRCWLCCSGTVASGVGLCVDCRNLLVEEEATTRTSSRYGPAARNPDGTWNVVLEVGAADRDGWFEIVLPSG